MTFMEQKKEKAVVTGGAGFIGSHLVDRLVEEGYDVHVIDDLSGGKKEHVHPDATLHVVDVRNRTVLAPLFDSAAYVFHLAALPRVQFSIEQPEATHDVNVTGTLNVLSAAHKAGARRVVFSSSSSVYGDQDTLPLKETMDVRPMSPYAMHKYMGEWYCRLFSTLYKLPTVSLRYFNVYGSRYDPEGAYALVIGKFLEQKKKGMSLTITGDGTQTRDFTHIKDVVDANIRAAMSEKVGNGEVFNIGAGKNYSVNQIAELIGGPSEHIDPRIEPHDTLADSTKAQEVLGWKPAVSLEEGIGALVKEIA